MKIINRNLIKGKNPCAVSLVRYSGPFLKSTREELRKMDQKSKLMTMRRALHQSDDIDRLNVCQKVRGRVLIRIEYRVYASIRKLDGYLKKEKRKSKYSLVWFLCLMAY